MNKISAKIVADSIDSRGNRIISYILTYPRFIHSELMTHRMFSRNAASSRAIPFEKMVKMVKEDPFIPIAWQKDHKGMQGTDYLESEKDITYRKSLWLKAKDRAISIARDLNDNAAYPNGDFDSSIDGGGVTKQLCNRLLEPFMWYTVLVTATEYDNFFELRCPKYVLSDGEICRSKKDAIMFSIGQEDPDFYNKVKDYSDLDWIKESKSGAEIHIQALAETMWDARNESTPKKLQPGEWHIPFGDRISYELSNWKFLPEKEYSDLWGSDMSKYGIKVATARCARLSYMTFDGEINYEKDIKLHDQLLSSGHMSPFEHCARVMSDEEYYSFIKGKVPTQVDKYGITNLEMMPFATGEPPVGFSGLNSNNGNKYGWCNNFRGFIPYRYLIENNE